MYMTPFQCTVTNPSKRVIAKPSPPVRCDGKPPCYLYPKWGNSTTVCPQSVNPLYWANLQGNNIDNPTNSQCAPTYNTYYGYPDGAQHQIFSDNLLPPPGSVGNLINSGDSITSSPSTILVSPSYLTKLVVQQDGDVVLADVNTGKIYWNTNTAGKGAGPYRLTIGWDGNLVLSDSQSAAIWSSNTPQKGYPPYRLKVNDLVSLKIVDSNSSPIWSAL